ncbi:carbohydrate ABC transporter permease [Kribbella kalugense]|uniref:Raffinose/stachyose/melibiose transport system permease protein n=1 Tax=Kribbella kalugense TaxID=2512221 RepID=A0A4R7ZVI2_9ACTN|nr:sugar ABC transporter permease [Kribbella kalugense]TDW21942.1 raffinose/stachyose/melibiose transport system permease protein [Kribbella kalugense]
MTALMESRTALAATDSAPRRNGSHLRNYLWALPAVILVVGVIHAGIAFNLLSSLFDWSGVGAPTDFIGAKNYQTLSQDPIFWRSLRNTLLFALVTVSVQLVLGLGLAILVRTKVRLAGLLRTMIFVPVVLAPAIVATSFRSLLTPDGAINKLIQGVGFSDFSQPWLADPKTAFAAIMLINVWQYTGYSFLIYDAAIGQVDAAIFESAQIDGASAWQVTRLILAPLLRGSHLVLIILGFVSSLKMFDLVYLTTGGGPGTTTQVLTGYIYRQVIAQFHAGYGAALSVILVAIAFVFSTIQVRLSTREAR